MQLAGDDLAGAVLRAALRQAVAAADRTTGGNPRLAIYLVIGHCRKLEAWQEKQRQRWASGEARKQFTEVVTP